MANLNVRLTNDINYGALQGLIGTWQGSNGVNFIAVPDQQGAFSLLVAAYKETLNVTAVPATTPNRGLQVIQQLPTLSYHTIVNAISDGSLMHVENGFWELIDNSAANNGFGIFRLATIPHGNAVVAMGNATTTQGPPNIDVSVSGLPVGDLPVVNGYTDTYIGPPVVPGFSPAFPNTYLSNYLAKQMTNGYTVTQTTTINVSTQNQGALGNIAQLKTNASATQFDATFWIETLQDPQGKTFKQLQYSQRIMLQFPIRSNMSGQTIIWPHFNVNTLTLV